MSYRDFTQFLVQFDVIYVNLVLNKLLEKFISPVSIKHNFKLDVPRLPLVSRKTSVV